MAVKEEEQEEEKVIGQHNHGQHKPIISFQRTILIRIPKREKGRGEAGRQGGRERSAQADIGFHGRFSSESQNGKVKGKGEGVEGGEGNLSEQTQLVSRSIQIRQLQPPFNVGVERIEVVAEIVHRSFRIA